jgi:hypothetical protein
MYPILLKCVYIHLLTVEASSVEEAIEIANEDYCICDNDITTIEGDWELDDTDFASAEMFSNWQDSPVDVIKEANKLLVAHGLVFVEQETDKDTYQFVLQKVGT